MQEFENNALFWQKIDALYLSGDYKVIYKKGQQHPKYQGLVFPCDYGHIVTLNSDEDTALKVYKSDNGNRIDSVVVCANLLSKHLTVNCLVGLDEKQKEEVLSFLNQNDYQKCIYIARGKKIPNWATSE